MSAGQTSARRGLTIAVTSGKGGVGKTTLAVNLGIALARFDVRVGIVDANFGLGNVDVMFGISPLRIACGSCAVRWRRGGLARLRHRTAPQ